MTTSWLCAILYRLLLRLARLLNVQFAVTLSSEPDHDAGHAAHRRARQLIRAGWVAEDEAAHYQRFGAVLRLEEHGWGGKVN